MVEWSETWRQNPSRTLPRKCTATADAMKAHTTRNWGAKNRITMAEAPAKWIGCAFSRVARSGSRQPIHQRGPRRRVVGGQIGDSIQQTTLVWRSRHFGGCQWFFVCPATGRLATVLWKPPGASRFCSRQAWGRQVAYASQFLDRDSRAHHGQAKLNARLCSIGQFDPDEWNFPPKPKWMRWKTYRRYEERFDRHE